MALKGVIFEDDNRLPARVIEILMAIPPEELVAISEEWLSRLEACIQGDGENVE
jgi:hypothetical protein